MSDSYLRNELCCKLGSCLCAAGPFLGGPRSCGQVPGFVLNTVKLPDERFGSNPVEHRADKYRLLESKNIGRRDDVDQFRPAKKVVLRCARSFIIERKYNVLDALGARQVHGPERSPIEELARLSRSLTSQPQCAARLGDSGCTARVGRVGARIR